MARAAPPAPARGPYRTGEETRAALLHAGLSLFGTLGYAATATRAVAARAGVAIPAIGYHFGGKAGLYLACADHVVARYQHRMAAPLAALADRLPHADPAEARRALETMLHHLVAMLAQHEGEDTAWLTFMLREMGGSGPAHDRLYAGLWGPGLALVALAVARWRGRDAVLPTDRLDALLVLSMPSVFAYAAPVATRFGGWSRIDPALAATITERIGLLLDGLSPSPA